MVYEYLQKGEENAISGREMCAMLGLKARQLTAAVEAERRDGAPICATTGGRRRGYYLASGKKEMRRYCSSLLHRAGEIHKTRRACLKTIDKLPDDE